MLGPLPSPEGRCPEARLSCTSPLKDVHILLRVLRSIITLLGAVAGPPNSHTPSKMLQIFLVTHTRSQSDAHSLQTGP